MTMRSATVGAARVLVAKLPRSSRDRLVRLLTYSNSPDEPPSESRDVSWRRFYGLAKKFDIDAVTLNSNFGPVTGLLSDSFIFQKLMIEGSYSQRMIDLLTDALRQGGTYIDIGANIGLTTLPIARLSDVSCIAIEPDATNFRLLEFNCRDHGNITMHNLAVCDKNGSIEFERSEENYGDHRLRVSTDGCQLGEESRTVVSVRCARLDDIVPNAGLKRPIVIKVDTQGAEAFVFAGGSKIIADAKLVVFEAWPYGTDRVKGDFAGSLTPIVTENFDEGCMANFDHDSFMPWKPIKKFWPEVLSRFDEIARVNNLLHFDVCVRKTA
jgi:FkbM family methyltransferase